MDDVYCIAWSPDGRRLATGSFDHTIRMWDVRQAARLQDTGELPVLRTFDQLGERQITSVAFTADSQRLLYTTKHETNGLKSISGMLDLSSGKSVVEFNKHTNSVFHGGLSRDGQLAATCDGPGEIFVWQTSDGRVVQKLAGSGHVAFSAAWNAEGTAIAWGNTNKNRVVNAPSPLERAIEISNLEISSASPAAFLRARVERGNTKLQSSGKTTVDVLRGDQKQTTLQFNTDYERQNNSVRSFTLVTGERAAVGASFGLYLFDTRTGKQLRNFQGHTGTVWAVSTSPDGRYLLSAADDMTLRIWDPDRDLPLLSLFFAEGDWVAWTPEGYYAASPGSERLMGWHLNNGTDKLASFLPAAQFRSTLYRPDVIKLLLKTGSVEKALEVADKARGHMTVKTEVASVLPPKIRITSPTSGHKAPQNTLEVRATATSTGTNAVTALRLLLDGRPYQGLKGVQTIATPKLGDVGGVWQVQLDPGRHKLKVLADSAVSQGVSEEVDVVYVGGDATEQVQLPKLYVVAIGISAYPGDLRLNYAAKDAEALSSALKSHSKSLFRNIEVQTITDAQATRTAILKGLSWLRGQMTQNDYGIFFFAGHGDLDNDGALYFLPVDADSKDLVSSAVPADQVKRVLSGIPGKMITIFDACHSAGIAGSQTGKRRAAATSLTDDLVRDLVTDENGVVAMCSSTGREFSLENNQFRQGSFTLAIIEGLSGKADFNKDGVVYLNELDTYVTDRVKELTRGEQHPVTAKPGSIRSFPLAKP